MKNTANTSHPTSTANASTTKASTTNASAAKARPRDYKYVYLRLWKYLSYHKWTLILALTLTVLSGTLGINGTALAGEAIGAIAGESEGSVYYYLLLMVICYTASTVISYLLSVMMVSISHKMACKMRTDVYNKLLKLPVSFFDKKQTGEIVSTVTYDINTVNESLSTDFIQIVSSLVTVVYSFVLMLTVSPVLILVFVVTIPCSLLFTRFISRRVRPLFRKRSAALGEMNGYVEEMIAGHKTIRIYGREDEVLSGFEEKNEAARAAYTVAEANGTMTGPTVNLINNLSLALVNLFGALLYMGGGILTLTGLSKFVLLSRKFSGPINQIANIYADIQSSLAASERVFHLLDEEEEALDSEGAGELTVTSGLVELSDVSFGYGKDKPVLKGLSLRAEPGSVTAIVGPTGAGKTTVINLLMRFYDIDSGSITIDGVSIYSLRRDSLRRAFTMVLQDTWLFRGTIYENVAYGSEGASREEVERVCRAAKIHNFIMSLPEGYDTPLSEAAKNISKGQKQLLTIARAMLIDSSMLILDEATSNVDSKTERDISEAMISLMKDKTVFVIAHRLSTVVSADKILVVKDGDVVEQGTHAELLSEGGFYNELYSAQFEI
ncbi:MAG: ABC transporter ATP-binding protein [Clostridia bacterium]|nr:ABC transporter ATP-binding protein [Clostridia bacterium]